MREIVVKTADGGLSKVVNRNTTHFFRGDLIWADFARHLIEKYENISKVNINIQACSDGSEAYSLAMMLISKLGDGAKKFFPIIAKDKDDFYLSTVKQGKVPIQISDLSQIEINTGKKTQEFLTIDKEPLRIDNEIYCTAQMNDKLRSAVVFEQADVLEDIDNIKKDNTVLMVRNFWSYLNGEEKTLAQKIDKNLGENSMCVIGEYEEGGDAPRYLRNVGFKDSKIKNCFEKEPYQMTFY